MIIFTCHGLNQNSSMSDLSFSHVTSVEKRLEISEKHISAYGLGLKKVFLGFLFSTSVTWEKLKSDVEKFYFRHDMEKNQNKILLILIMNLKIPIFFQILPQCTVACTNLKILRMGKLFALLSSLEEKTHCDFIFVGSNNTQPFFNYCIR